MTGVRPPSTPRSRQREGFGRLHRRVPGHPHDPDALDRSDQGEHGAALFTMRTITELAPALWAGPSSTVHLGRSWGLTRLRCYLDEEPTTETAAFPHRSRYRGFGPFTGVCGHRHRQQTGKGDLIESDQSEEMMEHNGEYFVDGARTGRHHGSGGTAMSAAPPRLPPMPLP